MSNIESGSAGIDCGASGVKAATNDLSGQPVVAPNPRGNTATPTAGHCSPNGTVLVGEDAVEQGYIDPPGYADDLKPRLTSNENVLRNGLHKTAADIMAVLLEHAREDLSRVANMEVTSVVGTCPAMARDDYIAALQDVFRRAGFEVVRIISEPVGAGYAFGIQLSGQSGIVLVVDIGHYTTDTTLLRVEVGQVTVLASEGIARAGHVLDEYLYDRFLDALADKCGKRPTAADAPLLYLDLHQRVPLSKASLNVRPHATLASSYDGQSVAIRITQAEYQRPLALLIQDIQQVIGRTLSSAGLSKADVSQLLLVGGTSRIPAIQDALARHCGLVPHTEVDPIHAVAFGAAQLCLQELDQLGRKVCLGGRVIPAPDVVMQDSTRCDVGCAVYVPAEDALLCDVLVPRNTPIPCHRTETFFLRDDDQTHANVEILQGTADAPRAQCLVLGAAVLQNLPKEPRRTRRIRIDTVIDKNSQTTVTVTDLVGGQSGTIHFDCRQGVGGTP